MGNHVIRDRVWSSRKLGQCSKEAAMAYPAIFLIADEWGRFEYRPHMVWSAVYGPRMDYAPNDTPTPQDVARWLDEYWKVGLLVRYHIEGDLAYWTGFTGRPPTKRRKSQYPDPEGLPTLAHKSGRKKAARPHVSVVEPDQTGATSKSKSKRQEQETGAGDESTAAAATTAVVVFNAEAPPATEILAGHYLACFNAVFGRSVGITPKLVEKVGRRLKDGYRPWQIVAVPILVEANGMSPEFRKSISPDIPLRDGKNPRTSNGQTYGATDWIERELGRIDRACLDERLTEIARQFGVLDQLMQSGVSTYTEVA